jgi:hypothetical protein
VVSTSLVQTRISPTMFSVLMSGLLLEPLTHFVPIPTPSLLVKPIVV